MHENEQHIVSQIASIMGSLVQLKKKIVVLNVECGMLRNIIVHLSKDDYVVASNQRVSIHLGHREPKEEDTMHQLFQDMEIGEEECMPTNIGLEESIRCHIFL